MKMNKKLVAAMMVGTLIMPSIIIGKEAVLATKLIPAKRVACEREINKIVAFGDSNSDNGEANRISKEVVAFPTQIEGAYVKPGEVYFENRYSNGKNALDILVESMDVELVNYAVGGATSGYANYTEWMDTIAPSGMLGQISSYAQTLEGKAIDAHTLHYIYIGANDYFKHMDYALEGEIEEVAAKTIENIKLAIRRLATLGAKEFFVADSMHLPTLPYEVSEGREETATAFMNYMLANLPAALDELEATLGVHIITFDAANTIAEIIENAAEHGITEIGTAAQVTWPEILPAVGNPQNYLNWDEWHYSEVTHALIGEAMAEQVEKHFED